MAKRNPEPEGTRESIRNTAAALFTASGVHAASLADIAEGAKLSKGTLYYHYPTKEELVLDIAEEYFGAITNTIFNWIEMLKLDTNAGEAVRMLVEGLWRDEDSMRLYYALQSEALREDGPLRGMLQTKLNEWAVMIEVGALKLSGGGAQRFRSHSGCFLALLDGCSMHRLLHGKPDAEVLIELLTKE